LTKQMRASPTRYRVVVLTSCGCSETDSQRTSIMLLVKPHRYFIA